VVHHHTHLIVSALARQGPANDAPDFAPVVKQAVQNMAIDRLFGDAGYDSESHHRLAREQLGIRSTVIPVNRRRSQTQQTRPTGRYRRWMHARFPTKLYRRRWHVESTFSQHKRRLGSALRSRSAPSRTTESLLRVITHDLMILPAGQRVSTEQSEISNSRDSNRPCDHYEPDSARIGVKTSVDAP
jgi:transposase